MRPVRFSWLVIALGIETALLTACTVSREAKGYSWSINQNETGLLLIHGLADTDVMDYAFRCKGGVVHLWYSLDKKDEPYGTKYATTVELTLGKRKRALSAQAEFADGGSPDIDATVADPASMLSDMTVARQIRTNDKWSTWSAPAPSAETVLNFARRCGIAVNEVH